MKIAIPEDAARVIAMLEESGFEAYAVGGCVRDSLMGRAPHDWDICTSALPEQVMRCFSGFSVLETGLKHGTVTVLMNHVPYEVTTFRTDGVYTDNRHPDTVSFVRTLREDLARRDFRVNAMAYSPSAGLVDCFGGRDDLRNGTICCVGDPDKRFQEDALRILRALRFSSTLGFSLEHGTEQSVHKNRGLLKNVAAERVAKELCGLLTGRGAGMALQGFSDVLGVFIPEIFPMVGFEQKNPHHCFDVWRHTAEVVSCAPEDKTVRLAALFHDIAKPLCFTQDEQGTGHFYGHPEKSAQMTHEILKRLKFDTETLTRVEKLVLFHDRDFLPEKKSVRKWLNLMGEENLRSMIGLKRADCMGQSEAFRPQRLEELLRAEILMNEILDQRQCFCIRDLAVNGRDVIEAGIPKGAQVGQTLNRLIELVIEERVSNDRDELLHQIGCIAKEKPV